MLLLILLLVIVIMYVAAAGRGTRCLALTALREASWPLCRSRGEVQADRAAVAAMALSAFRRSSVCWGASCRDERELGRGRESRGALLYAGALDSGPRTKSPPQPLARTHGAQPIRPASLPLAIAIDAARAVVAAAMAAQPQPGPCDGRTTAAH